MYSNPPLLKENIFMDCVEILENSGPYSDPIVL